MFKIYIILNIKYNTLILHLMYAQIFKGVV